MATKTSLLGLTKPAYTEAADIAVLNTNFDLIDKAVGQGARVYNLLDNSWFVNPINQRGQTVYTGSGFTVDRWRTWSASATITLPGDGVRSDGTDSCVLYQGVEAHKVKLNTAYTAAAGYSDGTIVCKSGVLTESNNIGVWSSDAQIYLAYNNGNPFVRLWHATKTIQWAAIYPGAYTAETLPAYVYKGYAAELAECQRYYLHVGADSNAWIVGQNIMGWGLMVEFPVQMRANGSVIKGDSGKVQAFSGSGWEEVSVNYVNVRGGTTYVCLAAPVNVSAGDSCLVMGIAGISADL